MDLMKKFLRESTRSTASTSSTPNSPLVVVNQASGASRVVAFADSLDSVHWLFFMIEFDVMADFVISICSLFPGFVELIASPGEFSNGDQFGETSLLRLMRKTVFLYGSLLRPPDLQSHVVCLCSLPSLTKNVALRIQYVLDGVVHKLCMISEGSFRHQNHSRKGENLKFAIDISCLDLYGVDYYDLLHLESLVCDFGIKMFMSFRGLRIIAPHVANVFDNAPTISAMVQHLSLLVKTEACCLEVLLTFGIERCLNLYVRNASQSCVSRQEIWSTLVTLIHEVACSFAEKGLCFKHDMIGWLQCFLYVMSQIQADDVFALCATPQHLLLTHSMLQLHIRCSFTLLLIMWNQAFFRLCRDCDYGDFHCLLECYELLMQKSLPPIFLQRQSCQYDFIAYIIVAYSGWLGSILEFLHGSLPRPPDVFKSKMEY